MPNFYLNFTLFVPKMPFLLRKISTVSKAKDDAALSFKIRHALR